MPVGFEQPAVLVVAGGSDRRRTLAATLEDGMGQLTVVTAGSLGEATERVDLVDGTVVELGGDLPDRERAVARLAEAAEEAPVVAVLDDRVDVTRTELLDAGATDVVGAGVDERVLVNRVDVVLSSALSDQAVRETQQRYHRLLSASPLAVVIHDADGAILYANEAAAAAAGTDDPYAVVGRSVDEFVAEQDHATVAACMERLIDGREEVGSVELWLEGVDGERRYVEATAIPVTVDGDPGGQVVLTDVTDRRTRERRLRAERDRFTALFDSLPEPAVNVRYEHGEPIVRNVNPAFEDVFGFTADTITGESLNDYIVPEDRQEEARELDNLSTEGTIEREVRRLTADGTREFLFSAQHMDTAEGTAEGVGIYVDITERKSREEALERQNERLDAFASIVSHDLQSPLSVAKGNLYLAREEDDESYLEKTEDALDRMERIIEDLLRLARSGADGIDPEPVDAGTVLAEAWADLDTSTGSLESSLEAELRADRGQLRELFSNLLRNALEHGGGDVTIEVGPIPAQDGNPSGNGGPVEGFYVADDGPGIPGEERDEVFDPGYTTHEEGSGFGLVVVAEIAKAHGWETAVTESDAGGARFEFRGVDTG